GMPQIPSEHGPGSAGQTGAAFDRVEMVVTGRAAKIDGPVRSDSRGGKDRIANPQFPADPSRRIDRIKNTVISADINRPIRRQSRRRVSQGSGRQPPLLQSIGSFVLKCVKMLILRPEINSAI